MAYMKHSRLAAILAAAFIVSAPTAARQTQKVLTPEAIITIAQVADAQMSPDGTQVAYQVSRPRGESDPPGGARAELWLVPAAGGEARRLTQEEDRAPRWSPDGRTIAFLGRRGKDALTQIHLINPAAGEARPLTTAPAPVTSFKWSPDGRSIAFTYADSKTDDEKKGDTAGRDWTVHDRNYKHTRLYRIDVAGATTSLVTQADKTVHDYDWSPDSAQLAAILNGNLWVIDLNTRLSQQITGDGQTTNPTWVR